MYKNENVVSILTGSTMVYDKIGVNNDCMIWAWNWIRQKEPSLCWSFSDGGSVFNESFLTLAWRGSSMTIFASLHITLLCFHVERAMAFCGREKSSFLSQRQRTELCERHSAGWLLFFLIDRRQEKLRPRELCRTLYVQRPRPWMGKETKSTIADFWRKTWLLILLFYRRERERTNS